MIKLLRADLIRLRKSFAFRLSLVGMLVLSSFFMLIQATAMDYTVPLSRVIFLPMSMYGVAMAAFVGVFVGTDFSDGLREVNRYAIIRPVNNDRRSHAFVKEMSASKLNRSGNNQC